MHTNLTCVLDQVPTRERICSGVVLLLSCLIISCVANTNVPFSSKESTMTTYLTNCFFWILASTLESTVATSLYHKKDRKLCSCLVRAPHKWLPPEQEEAMVETCSPEEQARQNRAAEETDLTDWLKENELQRYEPAFRKEEIHTLDDLKECRFDLKQCKCGG